MRQQKQRRGESKGLNFQKGMEIRNTWKKKDYCVYETFLHKFNGNLRKMVLKFFSSLSASLETIM